MADWLKWSRLDGSKSPVQQQLAGEVLHPEKGLFRLLAPANPCQILCPPRDQANGRAISKPPLFFSFALHPPLLHIFFLNTLRHDSFTCLLLPSPYPPSPSDLATFTSRPHLSALSQPHLPTSSQFNLSFNLSFNRTSPPETLHMYVLYIQDMSCVSYCSLAV